MNPRRLLPLALLALCFMQGSVTGADRIHRTLASPLVDEGSGPDGCEPELSGRGGPVKWEVRVERYLPDGKGLVEVSRRQEEDRYPLCIAEQPLAKNAEVELEFVTHAGALARTAGVVLRFADAQDYYFVRADALANAVRLIRVTNGTQTQIAAVNTPIIQGRPQKLRARALDDVFTVWLEGRKLFEARDGKLLLPGRFGIWSKSDSATSYGDLFITVLD